MSDFDDMYNKWTGSTSSTASTPEYKPYEDMIGEVPPPPSKPVEDSSPIVGEAESEPFDILANAPLFNRIPMLKGLLTVDPERSVLTEQGRQDALNRAVRMVDTATETANVASGNLPDILMKGAYATAPWVTAEDYDRIIEERKQRLGTSGQLASVGLSMAIPTGPISQGARAISPLVARGVDAASELVRAGNLSASRFWPAASRTMRQGLLGGTSTVASDLALNPEDYDLTSLSSAGKAGLNFGLGAIGGAGIQAAFGEAAPILAKWAGRNMHKSTVLRYIADKTASDTGLSREELIKGVKNGDTERGFLGAKFDDPDKSARFNESAGNAIMRFPIAQQGPYTNNPGRASRAGDLKQLNDDVNFHIQTELDNYKTDLDKVRGKFYTSQEWDKALMNDPNLKIGRELYDELENVEGLGGTPLGENWGEVIDELSEGFAKNLGEKSITDVGPGAKSAFNELTGSLRSLIMTSGAKKLRAEAQADHHTPLDQLAEHQRKELTVPTVARAVKAAKELNARRVGDIFNKNTITMADARNYFAASKTINDTIADVVGEVHKNARESFSKYMSKREGFDLGYNGELRNRDFTDVKGHRSTLQTFLSEMTPEQASAVKEGAKASDAADIARSSFNDFMDRTVGVGYRGDLKNPADMRQAGVEYLEAVYGKDTANRMLKLYSENSKKMGSLVRLKAAMDQRMKDTDAVFENPSRQGDLLSLGFSEGDWTSAAKLGAAGRLLARPSTRQGEALVDLFKPKGEAGNLRFQEFEKAASMPEFSVVNPLPLSATIAGAGASDDSEPSMLDTIKGWVQ